MPEWLAILFGFISAGATIGGFIWATAKKGGKTEATTEQLVTAPSQIAVMNSTLNRVENTLNDVGKSLIALTLEVKAHGPQLTDLDSRLKTVETEARAKASVDQTKRHHVDTELQKIILRIDHLSREVSAFTGRSLPPHKTQTSHESGYRDSNPDHTK